MTPHPSTAPELGAAAFDRSYASSVVLDGQGLIIDTNAAWRLFAHLNDGTRSLTGTGCNYLAICDEAATAGAPQAAQVAEGLRRILRGEIERFDLEYPCSSPVEDRHFLLQAAAAPVDGGTGIVLFHLDVTSHKVLTDRLTDSIDHDPLTGLPGWATAIRIISERLSLCEQQSDQLRLLSADITGLTHATEEFGRHVGDELIVKVALRILAAIRGSDRLCRTGEGRFVLICDDLGPDGPSSLISRLRHVMRAPFQVGPFDIEAGVVVATIESDSGTTVEELVGSSVAAGGLAFEGGTVRRPDLSSPYDFESPDPPVDGSAATRQTQLAAIGAHAIAHHAYSSDVVMLFSQDGTIRSASESCQRILGIGARDLLGTNGLDMIHPDDQRRVFAEFASISNLGDHVRTEFRIIDLDGRIRWLEEDVTNLVEDRQIGFIVGAIRDVTERVHMTQQIERDRRRLANAQAVAHLGSFEIDLDTSTIVYSEQFQLMLGVNPDQGPDGEATSPLDLTHRFDLVHPDDNDRVHAMFTDTVETGKPTQCVYRITRPDGETRWMSAHVAHSQQHGQNIISGTMLDITERHDYEATLAHQATHDWLTQLPNHAFLHTKLTDLMQQPGGARVAVAVVDLDHFKTFNDRDGHTVGDYLLRVVADLFRKSLRPGDFVARFGGDGFVVVRQDVDSIDAAHSLGDDIAALLIEPVTIDGRRVQLTASIGVAVSTAADTTTSVLRDADDAMYQAKRDGKNRVTAYDDDSRDRAHRRQRISASLPAAIDGKELHLEYQPIVHIASGLIAGFEALARWEHPTLGTVSPNEFIPIAEATGMILPLGAWVLDTALRQLSDWRRDPRLSADLWMAINVSPAQLADPQLVHQLTGAITQHGLPPEMIHLEITESVLMDEVDNALATIAELQRIGFHLSIDDFGTGYSSLSYLSRLPVDTIKIDRSFINNISETTHGTSIVRSMITLAASLDLQTVAEGIETETQRAALSALGCTYGQGFLWGRSKRPLHAVTWMLEQAATPRSTRSSASLSS